MAQVLTKNEEEKIQEFIGRKCSFTLLYKITRDGCDAKKFHSLCDGKGSTVTILHSIDGSVFGGYVTQSWDSTTSASTGYKTDANAFLFRVRRNGAFEPVKMPVCDNTHAIFCTLPHGPTFGGGHDLLTFMGTIEKTEDYFPLNGYCNYGHSYDMQGEDANSINNGHLNVKDLEVYQVEEGAGPLLEQFWRCDLEWNKQTLHQLIRYFRFYKPVDNVNVPDVNILLLGQVAAGKSSFFNTINSVFRGKVSGRAACGTSKNGKNSLTTKFRCYGIKDVSSSRNLRFRFYDTCGLKPGGGSMSLDISSLLDGEVPGHQKNSCGMDKVHAVALVIDASTFHVMPENVIAKMKDYLEEFRRRDLPTIVFLTKIDKVCEAVKNNLQSVFRSGDVLQVLEKVADRFGLSRGHVFPVKNYECETDLDDSISILALKALKQLLDFTTENMEDKYETKGLYNSPTHRKQESRAITCISIPMTQRELQKQMKILENLKHVWRIDTVYSQAKPKSFAWTATLDALGKRANCFELPRGHEFIIKNYEEETNAADKSASLS